MASEQFHEIETGLSPATRDMHRALVSLQEELDAIDWYRQRADVCQDAGLKALLQHNMREEMEHSAMLIEWLRRHDSDFDTYLQIYVFTEAPITEVEEQTDADSQLNPKRQPWNTTSKAATIGTLQE